jgi:hypothetical protein
MLLVVDRTMVLLVCYVWYVHCKTVLFIDVGVHSIQKNCSNIMSSSLPLLYRRTRTPVVIGHRLRDTRHIWLERTFGYTYWSFVHVIGAIQMLLPLYPDTHVLCTTTRYYYPTSRKKFESEILNVFEIVWCRAFQYRSTGIRSLFFTTLRESNMRHILRWYRL